ncbi:MAG: hypothetical protein IJ733_10535 [Lachnospiraceae bacterium]|nr:hypothetical protein [Lachnospiraceae bacterium]
MELSGWLDGSQKLAMKTSLGSSTSVGEPFFTITEAFIMDEHTLLQCLLAFQRLTDIKYHIVLGRAGKTISFDLTFSEYDCHHLMGIHYLADRPDRRSSAKIFEELLTSAEYRTHIASSDFWSKQLIDRIACTSILEQLIDDNQTIFRFNSKGASFHSLINAEYLMANSNISISGDNLRDVYVFLDKRDDSDNRFCRSIFPRTTRDFTIGQPRWTLLYKKKYLPDGTESVLYYNKNYVLPEENLELPEDSTPPSSLGYNSSSYHLPQRHAGKD